MKERKSKNQSICVLISCMHQEDDSIIKKSNLQTDAVVVNQCDRDCIEDYFFLNKDNKRCHVKFICTTERGLSRSRNMAIKNAIDADICLLSDDDERFEDDYENKIKEAYTQYPEADFISFACNRIGYTYPTDWKKMNLKDILKTSSIQITFRREVVLLHNLQFDEKMGSGTGNGAGEENKFMMDCKKKGCKMLYCPSVITTLLSSNSLWHNGVDDKYLRNRGWSSRRILGPFIGYIFIWYNILNHRHSFVSKDYSLWSVIKCVHQGFFEKR